MSFKEPIRHTGIYDEPEKIVLYKMKLKKNPNLKIIEPLGNNNSFFVRHLEAEYSPIIWIVSPGASGSSLLHDNLGKDVCPYKVAKSHSYHVKWKNKNCLKSAAEGGFMWEIEEGDKVIYLYSHPLNIVLSYHKKVSHNPEHWTEGNPQYSQFLECDIEKDFIENYLYEDILNLEKHLDNWWKQNNFDLLCIKYEKLHDCQKIIRKFLEGPTRLVKGGNRKIDLKLPPKRKRRTNWTKSAYKELLLKTYTSVIEKYEQKPDYELFLKGGRNIDDI
jgi:hypothetical protein